MEYSAADNAYIDSGKCFFRFIAPLNLRGEGTTASGGLLQGEQWDQWLRVLRTGWQTVELGRRNARMLRVRWQDLPERHVNNSVQELLPHVARLFGGSEWSAVPQEQIAVHFQLPQEVVDALFHRGKLYFFYESGNPDRIEHAESFFEFKIDAVELSMFKTATALLALVLKPIALHKKITIEACGEARPESTYQPVPASRLTVPELLKVLARLKYLSHGAHPLVGGLTPEQVRTAKAHINARRTTEQKEAGAGDEGEAACEELSQGMVVEIPPAADVSQMNIVSEKDGEHHMFIRIRDHLPFYLCDFLAALVRPLVGQDSISPCVILGNRLFGYHCLYLAESDKEIQPGELVHYAVLLSRTQSMEYALSPGDRRLPPDNPAILQTYDNVVIGGSTEGIGFVVLGGARFTRETLSDRFKRSYYPIYALALHTRTKLVEMQRRAVEKIDASEAQPVQRLADMKRLVDELIEFSSRFRTQTVSSLTSYERFHRFLEDVLQTEKLWYGLHRVLVEVESRIVQRHWEIEEKRHHAQDRNNARQERRQRMYDQVLTIVTLVFLPLTLSLGLFGGQHFQNDSGDVRWFPFVSWPTGESSGWIALIVWSTLLTAMFVLLFLILKRKLDKR